MRQFAQKGPRLQNLSVEAKLVYSTFGLLSLAAIVVSVLLYSKMFAEADAAEYYAGQSAERATDSNAGTTAITAADEGPAIALPDEPTADLNDSSTIVTRVTSRKLLEVTHFHLFTVPVFLLIISHLFMMCAIRPRLKRAIIVGGGLITALHLAAPWLIRGAGSNLGWLMPATGAGMGVAMFVMTLWPCVAMWLPSSAKTARSA